MAFNQQKIDRISDQTRGIFDTFIYSTSDTCDDVEAVGYFDECRFALNEPDKWIGGMVEVKCADGLVKGFINTNGDFVRFIPQAGVCAWLSYTEAFDTWDIPAVFDNTTKTVTLENTSGLAVAGYKADGSTWTANEGIVSFEQEVVEIDNPAVFDQSIFIGDGVDYFAGAYITSIGGGEIRDLINGVPLGSITMEAGYIFGFKFDPNTNTFDVYDNQANEFLGLSGDPAFVGSATVYFAIEYATNNANKFVNIINTGNAPFALPQSEGTYCSPYVPAPIVTCGVVALSNTVVTGSQTVNITSQSVEVISLGVAGSNNAISGAQFTTAVDEVKFEAYLDSVTPNPLTGGFFVPAFFDEANALLVAAVAVTPDPTTGSLYDVVSGVPIANVDPIEDGYKCAIYLDPAGTASYKDTNGIATSIGVALTYDNAEEMTETVYISAGDTVTDEINVTLNCGNALFDLGEDAERWCNV